MKLITQIEKLKKSSLCHFSSVYMFVKGTTTVEGNTKAAPDPNNKQAIHVFL